jgi:hypothetical protein
VSYMLSVTCKPYMLSVVMLNVVMPSVVAPIKGLASTVQYLFLSRQKVLIYNKRPK